MIEVHRDPEVNYLLLKHVRDKWPQINEQTAREFVDDYTVAIDEPFELSTRQYEKMNITREELRDALRDNMGLVINDRNYLLKIINQYFREQQVIEKELRFEVFDIHNSFHNGYVMCVYEPETDTLYIKDE